MKLLPTLLAISALSCTAVQAVDTTEILNGPTDEQPTSAAPVAKGKPIFNGKDLTGWKGVEGFWSVQDGAITGRTTKENAVKENTFLIWDGEVGDFELTCKYKITDDKGNPGGNGNSGIQYRSKVVKPEYSVVAGYQADFESGKSYSGILYEEKGRGILAKRGEMVVIHQGDAPNKPKIEKTGSVGRTEELQAAIKDGDWNEYRIVAKGNQLKHFINGRQMVSVTDETAEGAKKGVLAFQLHGGTQMTVQFKDVLLKTE
ncbi:MAG: DUF1080 domain-containing protein [Chthoniobacter sp.]|nr:DUF1080 domain-containing protein [Chthoniobacter sp.]